MSQPDAMPSCFFFQVLLFRWERAKELILDAKKNIFQIKSIFQFADGNSKIRLNNKSRSINFIIGHMLFYDFSQSI